LYFLRGVDGIYYWDGRSDPISPIFSSRNTPVDLDPDRRGRLYIVNDRRLYVYDRSNGTELSGLPAHLGVSSVRSPLTKAGVVLAGTTDGLCLSRDYGITWEEVEVRGLTLAQVFGIYLDPAAPLTAYLATSRGAFRVSLAALNPSHKRRRVSAR